MKRILSLFIALAAGTVTSMAETNTVLSLWVQDLSVNVSGWANSVNLENVWTTNSSLRTNGIIGTTSAKPVRLTSSQIIRLLSGQSFPILEKGLTNYTITNIVSVPGPNITNYELAEVAFPVFTNLATPVFTSRARLLLVEPLSINSPGPIPVIRDGSPAVDYVATPYLSIAPSDDAGGITRAGRYDLVHQLVSTTELRLREIAFTDNLGTFVWLRGLSSERMSSIIHGDVILARSALTGMSASLTGSGELGTPPEPALVQATVAARDGRLESR